MSFSVDLIIVDRSPIIEIIQLYLAIQGQAVYKIEPLK